MGGGLGEVAGVAVSRRFVLGGLGAMAVSRAVAGQGAAAGSGAVAGQGAAAGPGAVAGSGVVAGQGAVGGRVALPLGLNTWSLRGLTHDEAIPAILGVMQRMGLRECQLLFSHAEPAVFDPGFAASGAGHPAPSAAQMAERQRKNEARAAWEASVPLGYFEALRERFHQAGVRIRAYACPLGSSPAAVERTLLSAKALGAAAVNAHVPEAQTEVVAAAAARHRMEVGIQVAEVALLAKQLQASPWFRADPDIGDLTRAGVDAMEVVRTFRAGIASVDLKDTVVHGGSVPFGTGQAPMAEVLRFLAAGGDGATVAYIDCDYPGTGRSTDEVERCVRYVRGVLGNGNGNG